MAGFRPVCEMQYDAFSYPCLDQLDLPRRPLPVAHRRRDGVPDHRADAVRRPGARAGAARRLARGVLRPHARDQGRDPVDAGRRQGPSRRGDPRRRPGRGPRAEAHLPDGARRGAGGRARGAAREGADRAPGLGRDGRSPTARWWRWPRRRPTGRRSVGRGARPALAEAARRGRPARVGGADRPGGGRRRGAARRRLRRRGGGGPRREGDPRPARADRARHRLRRAVPVLDDRGRLPAVARACARRDPKVMAF